MVKKIQKAKKLEPSKGKTKWITLSCNANINKEALVDASKELGTSVVVGSMPGRPGRPDTFKSNLLTLSSLVILSLL